MANILVELHVEMEDGTTYDVVADQRDIAKWEIQDFGCPFNDLETRPHLGLRWLAWSALSRRGLLPEVDKKPMSWDRFYDLCLEVSDPVDDDGDEEQGDPDPGQPAPSEESSSSSPGAPGSR